MNTASETQNNRNALSKLMKDTVAKELLLKTLALSERLVVIGNVQSPTFYWVSTGWTKILGFDFEEMVSNDYWFFIHPEDHERSKKAFEYFQQKHKTGYHKIFPNRYRKKDGGYVKLGWESATLLDDGSNMYSMECRVLSDTEYQRAVENLKTYWDD